MKNKLSELFEHWAGETPEQFKAFPSSGSNRKYYRISSKSKSVIGVVGEDAKENKAFIEFSRHFKKSGLHVPEIYTESLNDGVYLQEDLGDDSLFDLVTKNKKEEIPEDIKQLYERSIDELIKFQVDGDKGLDYSLCFPVSRFTRESMQWDLNYFKYYYLKPAGIVFDELSLENSFQTFLDYLEEADYSYFTYRDFQTRNILIRDNNPWFIDYQGGRKGPLQYDLASILFQAKANLPPEFRAEMLNYYMDKLGEKVKVDKKSFVDFYYGFVLLRTLQVLGAYGYRGFFEQKPHFIESAKYALENLVWILNNTQIPVETPELSRCLVELCSKKSEKDKTKSLTIDVCSFSFLKYGYPKDQSGHGGGFVFDCRALPNPGRYPEYKELTGKDKPVIDFLGKEQAVSDFLASSLKIVSQAVDNYLVRGFDHLSVSFGCTGGQHRSVFCAEHVFKYLQENYRINVKLSHKMLD